MMRLDQLFSALPAQAKSCYNVPLLALIFQLELHPQLYFCRID